MSTASRPTRGRPSARGGAPGPGAGRQRGAAPRDGAGASRPRTAVDDRPRAAARGSARSTGDSGNGLDRLRVLLASTMGAVLAGYTLLVPVAAVLAGTGGVPVTADGALATAVPMWLAAHQIPIALGGRPLGVLPLLPTLVVVAIVAWSSRWAVRSLGGRVRHDAGAVVAAQAGAAAAVAVLAGALLPKDMAVTAPWASLAGAGLVGGAAAGLGVLHACGPPAAWRRVLAGWPGAALAGARIAAAGLLLVGALVLTTALALAAPAVADTTARLGPGLGAGIGVLVLAIGYLPNALVGALSWALGPGVGVGIAHSGPLLAEPGPLPPFPLAVVLPVTTAAPAAPLVLLLPVAVGALAGAATRRALGAVAPVAERLAAPATAAAVVAAGACLLATVAGGPLAGGPYDPVSFHPGGVFLAVLLLIGIPAVLAGAGPELARRVPVGGAAAPRATGDRRRAGRATVAELVERRRTSGAGSRAATGRRAVPGGPDPATDPAPGDRAGSGPAAGPGSDTPADDPADTPADDPVDDPGPGDPPDPAPDGDEPAR